MYRIINSKRYDTRTANELASNSSGCGKGDFNWFEESLYKTPRGNYFIAGSGGPMSGYAEAAAGGGWNNGSDLKPIDKKSAAEWCEHTGNYETLEQEFPDTVTDA